MSSAQSTGLIGGKRTYGGSQPQEQERLRGFGTHRSIQAGRAVLIVAIAAIGGAIRLARFALLRIRRCQPIQAGPGLPRTRRLRHSDEASRSNNRNAKFPLRFPLYR
jgi:hypothetical protein